MFNDNTARQYGFVRSGSTISVRVNGASNGTTGGTSVNTDATGVGMSIGGLNSADGLHPLVGDIAELIIVKGAINGADRDAIELYLRTKYAL